MKNLFSKLTLVVLSLSMFAGCQKDSVGNEQANNAIKVASVAKSNYVYKDTTTKKVSATNTNGTLKTSGIIYSGKTHLNVTYLGNGNYDLNPGIDLADIGNFAYYLRNQYNAVVYTFFHNHRDITETVTGLPPGTYTVQIDVSNTGGAMNDGTYYTRTFTVVAEPSAPTGTVHLLRYLNRISGFHFYTTDWQENASENNQYVFETVQGYVYSFSSLDPNSTAIYRYYNNSIGDHLYSHVYSIPSGYVYEGITGYCLTGASGNFNRPLYRAYNSSTAEHFYFCPPESPSGFNIEGTVGYIQ